MKRLPKYRFRRIKRRRDTSKDFKLGVSHGMPIAIGYVAVSFAFGMNVCAQGFNAFIAAALSLTNLTSAGQFAGTSLMLAGGTFLQLVVTMLVINSRYFLMGLTVSQRLDQSIPTRKRLVVAFGVTDEIFAMSTSRGVTLTYSYMLGIMIPPIIGWTLGTLLGGLFSNILPEVVVSALSSALYAMFLAIIIPPSRKSYKIAVTVALGAAISICFAYIDVFKVLSSWGIIIITVIVSSIMALLFPISETPDAAEVEA